MARYSRWMKAVNNAVARKYLRGYTKPINFYFGKPNFANEWGEISKKVKGDSSVIDEHKVMGYTRWVSLAKTGGIVKVDKKMAKVIENTEAATPNKFDTLTKDRQARVIGQINSGHVELSIVASYDKDYKYLIAGNTRLTAMMKFFGHGYVWEYNVPYLPHLKYRPPVGSMFPNIRRTAPVRVEYN